MTREDLMRKAIELSKENVENGGGPFGAVIATKEGEIVATGVNRRAGHSRVASLAALPQFTFCLTRPDVNSSATLSS